MSKFCNCGHLCASSISNESSNTREPAAVRDMSEEVKNANGGANFGHRKNSSVSMQRASITLPMLSSVDCLAWYNLSSFKVLGLIPLRVSFSQCANVSRQFWLLKIMRSLRMLLVIL